MAEGIDQAWISTDVGRHLRHRRNSGTAAELRLRRALHAAGLRYRLGVTLGRSCTPDLVFTHTRLAVFVDGCFWHNCPRHGRRSFKGPNARLWEAKIARNRRNDDRANQLAAEQGYGVLRFWECEVTGDSMPTLVKRVAKALRTRITN